LKELERFLTFYYPFLPGTIYSALIFIVTILMVWILFDVHVLVFPLVLAYVGFALWLSTFFQLMWFTDLELEEGQKELAIADKKLYPEYKEERMASRIGAVKKVGVGFIITAGVCVLVYKLFGFRFETPQQTYQSVLRLIYWGTMPSGMFMNRQARKFL
jgi:hypothetical protein